MPPLYLRSRRVGPVLALLLGLLALPQVASAQPYGLTSPVPVGPFLDGALPDRTPSAPTGGWSVIPAFAVNLDLVLTVASTPANNRLYVGSREGVIVSFENNPASSVADPFLDLSDRVRVVWDGGFLGMVFHPEFGVPGSDFRNYFYVFYASHCDPTPARDTTDLTACDPTVPETATSGFFGAYLRLSRFEVPDGQTTADPASERILANIRLYNTTHRGGGMAFDNAGHLYVTIGEQNRPNNAQEITNSFEGGTIRIFVDVLDGQPCPAGTHAATHRFDTVDEITGQSYCIPDDNPFPGPGVFEEFCTLGHRNPHRLSYDPVEDRLWSAEVGEASREEVNVLECGNNYGWPFREGLIVGPDPPPPVLIGTLTDPVIDFDRSQAAAIIGGYVYRGTRFPTLVGKYLAGDYVTGNIWEITLDPGSMTATSQILTGFSPGSLGTWGQDNQGEVYLGSVAQLSGPLYTLDLPAAAPEPPALLSSVGAFTDLANLVPHPAFVPYALNEPFWSDNAHKTRWIAVPNDGVRDAPDEQVAWSATGDWVYPPGTVAMKHFELATDENDPSITTRLETRFEVLGTDFVWYGITYRWLPDGSDAQLLTGAETGDYTIDEIGGGSRVQTWLFPSRIQCAQCHNANAGGALGLSTHQLNRTLTYPSTGISDNQLRTWNQLGMFAPALVEPDIPTLPVARTMEDVTAPLEDRARAWLDSNCSYCHRPGGTNAFFDARLATPLEQQGLLYGLVGNDLGIPGAHVITPGDLVTSVLYHRIAALDGTAMPPLAKNLVDQASVDRVAAWIERSSSSVSLPGLSYEYFELDGTDTVVPDYPNMTPDAVGEVAGFDLSPAQRPEDFGLRYTGLIQIPETGTYTFHLASDDGSLLFINGGLLIDNDGLHAYQEVAGAVSLTAGYHDIEVRFFEHEGDEVLEVRWESASIAKQLVPNAALFRAVGSGGQNGPPVVSPVTDVVRKEGDPLGLQVQASDPDGDPLYYEAANLPPGVSLDPDTGASLGAAAPGSAGIYTVTLGVSDGPTSASTSFEVVVQAPGGGSCGLGAELAFLLPPLAALRRRRRARRA